MCFQDPCHKQDIVWHSRSAVFRKWGTLEFFEKDFLNSSGGNYTIERLWVDLRFLSGSPLI